MTYFNTGMDAFNSFSHLVMEMLRNLKVESREHHTQDMNTILSKYGLEAFYASCFRYHNLKCVDAREGLSKFLHSLQCYDKDDLKNTSSFLVCITTLFFTFTFRRPP